MAFPLFSNHCFHEAGQTLISATAASKRIVTAEHPTTLSHLLKTVIRFRQQGKHEVALAMLQQFSALGEILLGERHPLHLIFRRFASMDPYQIDDIVPGF